MATNYTRAGMASKSGTFTNSSLVSVPLWEYDASLTQVNSGEIGWRIYLSYQCSNDSQLYMALYDGFSTSTNRLTNIDTQYMSLYNNDVGSFNNNVNYVRLNYYATGNGTNEGGQVVIDLHNAQYSYPVRDSTTDRLELARSIQGTFVHGHNYTSDYQMTDVGSFNHESSANPYSNTYFALGVRTLGFYMGAGTMNGTYEAFPSVTSVSI